MKLKSLVISLLFALCFILTAKTSRADAIYIVTLNTSSLIGHPAGPFSLNFQFNDGSGTGDANNTVTLSNFQFGGGGSVGMATAVGGASGSLATAVVITDSSFFNSFTQEFTPGLTLSFNLALTTNLDLGGTPDQFSFAILDSTGAEIPTLSSFFDVFLIIDIDSNNPALLAFGSDPTRSPLGGGAPINTGAPTVQAVPEPTSIMLLGTGLAGVCAAVARRKVVTKKLSA